MINNPLRYVDPTGKTLSDINVDNFVKDFGIDKIANFAGGIIGSVENTGKNVVNTTKGGAYLWIGSIAREGGRFVGSPLLTMVGENLAKEGLDNIKSHSVGLAVDTATIVAFEGVGKLAAPVLKPIVAELERKLYFLNVEINLVKKKIQVLEKNKIHKNSLDYEGPVYGYHVKDRNGNIIKIGESWNPEGRYTKKKLREEWGGARIFRQTDGMTKKNVKQWETNEIREYERTNGAKPKYNKTYH